MSQFNDFHVFAKSVYIMYRFVNRDPSCMTN